MPIVLEGWHIEVPVTALPGYFIADTPWAGRKTQVTSAQRNQSSALLGGGQYYSGAPAQNMETYDDHWFATGTYKTALLHITGPSVGIYHVTLDGGSNDFGTIDGYGAGTTNNIYSEITGVAVTAGLKTFGWKMKTKNASATNYQMDVLNSAAARTGA